MVKAGTALLEDEDDKNLNPDDQINDDDQSDQDEGDQDGTSVWRSDRRATPGALSRRCARP